MDKLKTYSEVINEFPEITRKLHECHDERIRRGDLINVFTLWNEFSGIQEPIHSRILHFLLSTSQMHGMGDAFINEFLKIIKTPIYEEGEWVSTAETGRVDIMFRHFHPRSVIIIENKSNWAEDQPNQLYRYWYQNIHTCQEDCFPDYYVQHSEFKIVYLVPSKDKVLSMDSRTKPKDLMDENVPDQLPCMPVVLSFKEEVAHWLDNCISILPEENTPLKNFINQYKEYCKEL